MKAFGRLRVVGPDFVGAHNYSVSLITFLFGLAVSLALGQLIRREQHLYIVEKSSVEAESVKREIVSRLDSRLVAIEQLAARWETVPLDREEWLREARLIRDEFSDFSGIAWVDQDGLVLDRVPSDDRESEPSRSLSRELARFPVYRTAMKRADARRKVALTSVIPLSDGAQGIAAFVPMYRRSQLRGFIWGSIDFDQFLPLCLPRWLALNYGLAVRYGETLVFSRAPPQPALASVPDPGRDDLPWQVWATPGRSPGPNYYFPTAVTFFGILLSLFFACIIHLTFNARSQSRMLNAEVLQRASAERDLRKLNETLEAQVEQRTASLVQRTGELVKSQEELEAFAYIASHDLQEPLRTISSFVNLLERKYGDALGQDAHEYIQFAVSGAARMKTLIESLLAYSRVGNRDERRRWVETDEIIDEVQANLAMAITESGAKVRYEALPRLFIDRGLLVQLFQNLIGNAIKYRSQRPPLIEIRAVQEEGHWLFSVRDNGIGFSEEDGQHIFEPFRRLQQGAVRPGNGLGLSICRKIVERFSGRIWAESRPGEGSVFYFTVAAGVPRSTTVTNTLNQGFGLTN